jgi:hypothetical protein
MKFSEIIHHNRDENSFTARVFESYLIPLWVKAPTTFQSFLRMLALDSEHNYAFLQKRLGQAHVKVIDEITANFSDSMLFLENLDIYGFCCNHNINLKIVPEKIDKTEFDCVVVAENESGNEDIFVFEVKCFTDLHVEEVKRQNQLLRKYQDAGLFNQFYHFAVLSTENIERGTVFKNPDLDELVNGIYVISWTGIMNYIDHFIKTPTFPRFINNIEFQSLCKSIGLNGISRTKRKLISDRKLSYQL